MKFYNSAKFIQNKVSTMTPSFRYDGSEPFEQWHQKAKDKLCELLGLPFEKSDDKFSITGECDKESFRQIDFEFQSEPGYFVQGSFCVPRIFQKPLPVVICLMGHASGKHIALGEAIYPGDERLVKSGRDFARRAVAEGYCAVVIEWRYMGDAGRNPDDNGPLCARKNAALPSLLLGRCAVGERVWDVQRLIDVIEKHFSDYADSTRIICLGHSGGGTATFYSACVDERIKMAIASGSVCSFDASIIPIHHCCCNYIPGIRKYFDMGDLGALIAPRKLIVVCGINDADFPIDGVELSFSQIQATYDKLGKGNLCRLVKGHAGHQFYPDDAWPVAHELFND